MASGDSPEFMQEVALLAHRAQPVFSTNAELRDWLVCTVRRALNGCASQPRAPCCKMAAAACAIRFGRECPLSSTCGELDEIINRLPTSRLEALLRLQHDADG
jgi:hypothetical protein